MEKITMQGEYQTRDGREVRLFTVDARYRMGPVVGEVLCSTGWEPVCWGECGEATRIRGSSVASDDGGSDLIPKPRTITVKRWVNVYANGEAYAYRTKSEADDYARESCFARKEIEITATEGEGLKDSNRRHAARKERIWTRSHSK